MFCYKKKILKKITVDLIEVAHVEMLTCQTLKDYGEIQCPDLGFNYHSPVKGTRHDLALQLRQGEQDEPGASSNARKQGSTKTKQNKTHRHTTHSIGAYYNITGTQESERAPSGHSWDSLSN